MKKVEVFKIYEGEHVDVLTLKRFTKKILAGEKIKKNVIINIILCNDKYITELNTKFVKHNYSTDVLAFPLSDKTTDIQGEIYINLDKVAEQAKEYAVTFREELARLVAHGLLHLIGYQDDTNSNKKEMHDLENYYVNKYIVDL